MQLLFRISSVELIRSPLVTMQQNLGLLLTQTFIIIVIVINAHRKEENHYSQVQITGWEYLQCWYWKSQSSSGRVGPQKDNRIEEVIKGCSKREFWRRVNLVYGRDYPEKSCQRFICHVVEGKCSEDSCSVSKYVKIFSGPGCEPYSVHTLTHKRCPLNARTESIGTGIHKMVISNSH